MEQELFSFRFDKETGCVQRKIGDNSFLRLFRLDDILVEMYFVDGAGHRINVPVGLVVINGMSLTTVPLYSFTQTFALAWSESYIVSMQGEMIARFSNKCWSLHSSVHFAPVSVM